MLKSTQKNEKLSTLKQNNFNICSPDVLDTVFVNAVINWNVEYRVDEANEQLMYGMFVIDIVYDSIQTIVRVIGQFHPLNSRINIVKFGRLVNVFKKFGSQ